MIGSIRWNFALGLCGFALTFLLSVSSNFVLQALIDGLYSFAVIFVIVFAMRWALGTVAGLKSVPPAGSGQDESVGQNIQAATPDDQEQLNDMLKEQLSRSAEPAEFVPLTPKKLTSIQETDAEKLAQALREMKE